MIGIWLVSTEKASQALSYFQVLEGYGQTECSAVCNLQLTYESEAGHVGPTQPCVMTKLVDVPDMNYYSKDNKGEVREDIKEDYIEEKCVEGSIYSIERIVWVNLWL